ncbi:MAG TPA: hypothetical protein VN155_15575 [Devosia sp.]|nr:hypothetical protein [Devosia sp.]
MNLHPASAWPVEPSASTAIASIIAALRPPRAAIDDAFLGVGMQLTECATILSRITATFEQLPADLDGAEVSEATGRLSVVGRRAGEIAAAFGTEQQDLARLLQLVSAADHPIAGLRRAVKMMGILAINARVVAAGVVDDDSDFDVFTTDIAQLSLSAADTIAEFSRTYRRLVEVVTEAAETRGRFDAEHRKPLADLARRLDVNLAEVTRRRQQSAENSVETSRMSRQISARVAEAVMALQVGDATRQRLEHIEAALAMSATSGQAICHLQHLQLTQATQSFEDEMAAGEQALRQLALDASQVLDHSRDVYGQGQDEGRSALGLLHNDVHWASDILADCEAERQKLDRVAADVAATVSDLLGHVEAVQDIEAKMRLVSLNAAIRCAQLGPRARALAVISQQLRGLTAETTEAAGEAVARLEEASGLARAFTLAADSAASGRVGDLEREANVALDLLETVDARMKAALADLGRDGPSVARRLEKAVANLGRHGEIAEALRDIGMQLAGQIGADALDFTSDEAQTLFAALRKTYTMDAERRIHDAFTGQPAPVAEAPAEDSIDDLLF